jgi:hypothetical protein
MQSPIITLTTDFGTCDPYVAAMKGVILTLNPTARIVDVLHQIPPQGIRQAALCVAAIHSYFPAGTIHVAVVDPGVGSERRLLCVSMHNHIFLAPDNGLLSWTARGASAIECFALTEQRFWRSRVSATFHGRDILAPVAAHLSRGVSPDQLGLRVHDWVELPWPAPLRTRGQLRGEVLAIDCFGNLITNISKSDLVSQSGTGERMSCGGVSGIRIVQTYAAAAVSELVAVIGSMDLVEIAVRNGNAAERLGASAGIPVIVQFGAATA